jgi:prepilin-type N-terminal cleavage/methylation domain-containing protein
MRSNLSRHRGLSLVELLIGVAISGIVAAGVAAMLGGVASGIAIGTDARTGMLATGVIQGRVVEAVTPARCVLASEPERTALWRGETRPGGLVEPSEIAWLRIDTSRGVLIMEYIEFPEGWGPIEQARADQPLRPNGDPFPLLEEARSAGILTTEILADGILNGTFIEGSDSIGEREVRIDIQLDLPTGPRMMTATAVFALPETPPEWTP